jgi:hypothetical protein
MMSRLSMCVLQATMATVFLATFTNSAHAYLDPGTGSMILQVLLGGFAGLALVGKLYWHKLLALFGSRTNAEADLTAERQSESGPDAPR